MLDFEGNLDVNVWTILTNAFYRNVIQHVHRELLSCLVDCIYLWVIMLLNNLIMEYRQ